MKSKILHVVQSRSRLLWFLPATWAGLLFVASSVPGTSYPEVSFAYADKLVHLGIYGVLGALLAWAARANLAWPTVGVWGFATGMASLYGATDELHQFFVPNRSADARDLLADALGAGLGAAVVLMILAWCRKPHRNQDLHQDLH